MSTPPVVPRQRGARSDSSRRPCHSESGRAREGISHWKLNLRSKRNAYGNCENPLRPTADRDDKVDPNDELVMTR